MIWAQGIELAEMSFGRPHSEQYKLMARLMRRMVDAFKETECRLHWLVVRLLIGWLIMHDLEEGCGVRASNIEFARATADVHA